MRKEDWLLKEISEWEQEALISSDVSAILKDRYTPKGNINILVVVFSVIGSLLIGTGIILMLARNWYFLPLFVRVALAFLPLLISQGISVFVVKYRYSSAAWREASAILVTASVFAVIAIVGQVFHLPGDYGAYILTCGLLSLPMIYILDAAAPLILYYWTVLNWAALSRPYTSAFILAGLFAAGAVFVFIKRKQDSARLQYMAWITLIAGFIAVLIMGGKLGGSQLLIALCYFTMLLSASESADTLRAQFEFIGLTGGLITAAVLTYEGMWEYINGDMVYKNVGGTALAAVMLTGALVFAAKAVKRDRLKFSIILMLAFLCLIRCIWAVFELDDPPYSATFMILSNLVLLSIGIVFIVRGVKDTSLLATNIGMVTVCALIVMRFFDSEMDFFLRGVVFLALGAVFLLVNQKILRKRKYPRTEVEQ